MFVGQGNTLPLSIRSKSVQLSKKQGIHCLCVDISGSEIGKHYLAYGDGPFSVQFGSNTLGIITRSAVIIGSYHFMK